VMAQDGEPLEELVGFDLAIDFEEQLEAVYEASEAPGAPESLEEAVEEALGRTPEEAIEEGLQSLTLGELLSSLLGEAAHPGALAGAIFAAAEQEEVQELLGTRLNGEPFEQGTVAEAASAIGVTATELAESVGKTPGELPPGALALDAPLKNGQALGVFAAAKGLAFALIGKAPAPEEEAEEPEGEETPSTSGGTGGTAGSGTGSGQSPTAPTSAVAQGTTATAPAAQASPATGVAKVRIVSRRARGSTVTLVLQVPARGTLTLSGKGVKRVRRAISRAGRVTIKLTATRGVAASLRRGRRLTLDLRATFEPVGGARSSATTTARLD
jgi:hypothetical protein